MRHGKRRRSAATNARVEADGSVDAQNAPTDPCKTTERFCTSSHTLHRRFPFQKNPRPEPLRISGQLPTDSAEEAENRRKPTRGLISDRRRGSPSLKPEQSSKKRRRLRTAARVGGASPGAPRPDQRSST